MKMKLNELEKDSKAKERRWLLCSI
ncbi:hypothetical protein W546_02697, partial [Staphylococcus aureus VET0278R]